MPTDSLVLHPPIQYSLIWLIIGSLLLLSILLWFSTIFWITRRKKINTLENLSIVSPGSELENLKQKYLQLIDECYQSYERKETNLRGLHRALSMAARYFVYEVKHFPAPRLTLDDLKKSPYPKLTELVEHYYTKEFATIEKGDPLQAVEAAKEFIRQWV